MATSRTSGHLRQADPYSLADETWRDPPRRSSTSSRSRSRRPGPADHYRLDAYSSEEEPPQDAESLKLAGQLTCLGAYTRHRRTLSLLLCIAGGLEQYSNRHQRPHQRSFLAASLHCPRNFLVQLLRYRQKQISQGNHLLERGLLFGLRVHSGTRRLREQGRTQKQVRLKPTTRVHRQAATAAGR